ncbi:MAG: hypothetical protein A2Y41_13320 [Spirochaetes bacterium GWB1_36_13]|nr:MAG: hypothetical protein A2Y41_13320 [Spirochaetes bacterium GWB1_36_13]
MIVSSDGVSHKPALITLYKTDEEGHETIFKNYSVQWDQVPEVFEIDKESRFELSYFDLVYADVKWYEIKPEFYLNGTLQNVPVIRFEPARDRDYHPFEIPFAFMPVR